MEFQGPCGPGEYPDPGKQTKLPCGTRMITKCVFVRHGALECNLALLVNDCSKLASFALYLHRPVPKMGCSVHIRLLGYGL